MPQSTSASALAVNAATGPGFARLCSSSRHLVGIGVGALELKPEPASGKVWAQDATARVDDPVKEDPVEAGVIGEVLKVPDVVDCAGRVQVQRLRAVARDSAVRGSRRAWPLGAIR